MVNAKAYLAVFWCYIFGKGASLQPKDPAYNCFLMFAQMVWWFGMPSFMDVVSCENCGCWYVFEVVQLWTCWQQPEAGLGGNVSTFDWYLPNLLKWLVAYIPICFDGESGEVGDEQSSHPKLETMNIPTARCKVALPSCKLVGGFKCCERLAFALIFGMMCMTDSGCYGQGLQELGYWTTIVIIVKPNGIMRLT